MARRRADGSCCCCCRGRGCGVPRLRGVDRVCQYRTHRVVVAAVAMIGGLVMWRWVRVASTRVDCVVARTAAWAAGRAHAAVAAAAACITTPPPLDVSLRRLASGLGTCVDGGLHIPQARATYALHTLPFSIQERRLVPEVAQVLPRHAWHCQAPLGCQRSHCKASSD